MISLFRRWGAEITPHIKYQRYRPVWRDEFLAAVIGTILVIPQGITFSYLVGVPPIHGIYCSILVTMVTAFLGNSILMSGPNTATSILLSLAVIPFAERGSPVYVDYVMLVTLMVGIVQLLAWLFRTSHFFLLITRPAIAGVTMGVGALIMMSSVNGILGLNEIRAGTILDKFVMLTSAGDRINGFAVILGLTTILSTFFVRRWTPRSFLLVGMSVGVGVSLGLGVFFSQQVTHLNYLGSMTLDFRPPTFHSESLAMAWKLLPGTLSVAFISLAQTMVIARDLKYESDYEVDLNKETFAIGVANCFAPFFNSYAGSGSFNRTQANRDMQARSPAAAIMTGVGVIAVMLLIGHWFKFMPISVITGTLFVVGFRMIKIQQIKGFMQKRLATLTFFSVIGTVLFWGLGQGIAVAIVLSLYEAALPRLRARGWA